MYALQVLYVLHHHPEFQRRANAIWERLAQVHRGNYLLLKLKGFSQRHLDQISSLLEDFFVPVDPFTIEVFRLYLVKTHTKEPGETLEHALFGKWTIFANTEYGDLYEMDRKYGVRLKQAAYRNLSTSMVEALNQPSLTIILNNNVTKAEWVKIWEEIQTSKPLQGALEKIMVKPVDEIFDREIHPPNTGMTDRIQEMIETMNEKRTPGKNRPYQDILTNLQTNSRKARSWSLDVFKKHYKEFESLICRLESFGKN